MDYGGCKSLKLCPFGPVASKHNHTLFSPTVYDISAESYPDARLLLAAEKGHDLAIVAGSTHSIAEPIHGHYLFYHQ